MAPPRTVAARGAKKRRQEAALAAAVADAKREEQAICDELEKLQGDIERMKRVCKILWLTSVSLFVSITFWRTLGNDHLIPWLLWKLTWSVASVSAVEANPVCGCCESTG